MQLKLAINVVHDECNSSILSIARRFCFVVISNSKKAKQAIMYTVTLKGIKTHPIQVYYHVLVNTKRKRTVSMEYGAMKNQTCYIRFFCSFITRKLRARNPQRKRNREELTLSSIT